ncbi:hypothetical protein Q3G72_031799 [Acer saccharum]|nr:hypothetical protein Q3G72_031799 [Acer saccharum]
MCNFRSRWKEKGSSFRQRCESHVERRSCWNYDSGVYRAGERVRSFNQNSFQSFSTFAGVVKGEKQRNHEEGMEKEEKCMAMRWKRQRVVDNWLSKCAVGVLKQFGNVSSVSKRLKDKGFRFSSSYAGDKSILWVFDSEDEKDVFMLNRFFWDDCFSSMSSRCSTKLLGPDFFQESGMEDWRASAG